MQHTPKQSHYVRCPTGELLCDSICGSRIKKFGDLCFIMGRTIALRSKAAWYCSSIYS